MADSYIKIAQEAALATEGISEIVFPGIIPYPRNIGKSVDLEVYLSFEYGVNIPEVAWNVQENIKKAIDSMDEPKAINRVNIHVESLNFKKKSYD